MKSTSKDSSYKPVIYLSKEARNICIVCHQETLVVNRNRIFKNGEVTHYGKKLEELFKLRLNQLDFSVLCRSCKNKIERFAEKHKKITKAIDIGRNLVKSYFKVGDETTSKKASNPHQQGSKSTSQDDLDSSSDESFGYPFTSEKDNELLPCNFKVSVINCS